MKGVENGEGVREEERQADTEKTIMEPMKMFGAEGNRDKMKREGKREKRTNNKTFK